jgi:glycosyltransferase involved in cell wall biosynthesis
LIVRVLHVMECTIGGTRRHLVDATLGLERAGLDIHVVASTLRQPEFEADLARLERAGVGVTRLPMVRSLSPLDDAAHLRYLRGHLERLRPDVVHTHSSKAGVLGRLASIQTSIGARVHTPHTFAFLFEAEFGAARRKLFREIERALAGHTQALVAVSPGEAETFVTSGVVERERVRVVCNGIDPAPWLGARATRRAELGLRDDAPLAAVIGLCNVAKGQDLVLDALAMRGLERLQVLFAGSGALEDALKARARRLRVDERVRFLGFRDDVPALLAASDFTIVPSRWEGMPYVVLESMASARAVVATPVDGSRDLVVHRETGLLARKISAESIAEAVRALLELAPAERARMGERGRERMRANYSADAMVSGLAAVYREVAS